MRFLSKGHLAALSLLVVPASQVAAGEIFHHGLCNKRDGSCETQRVTLPQRQVEIVTEQPRVTVRESAPIRIQRQRTELSLSSNSVAGVVYMPMAMPMMGVSAFPGVQSTQVREVAESNPLESVHRVELLNLRRDQAMAQLQVELETTQRAMLRNSTPAKKCEENGGGGGGNCAAIEARVKELATRWEPSRPA